MLKHMRSVEMARKRQEEVLRAAQERFLEEKRIVSELISFKDSSDFFHSDALHSTNTLSIIERGERHKRTIGGVGEAQARHESEEENCDQGWFHLFSTIVTSIRHLSILFK